MDEAVQEYLSQAGIAWDPLAEVARGAIEAAWRRMYGQAFRGRPRLKHGARAEHEYLCQACDHFFIIPFSAGVAGLPLHVRNRTIAAYECRGPLIALGEFSDAEFFIAPPDLMWTMIHTHEDHAFGGPYFMRADWVTGFG